METKERKTPQKLKKPSASSAQRPAAAKTTGRKTAAATAERRRSAKRPSPDVVYVQPMPFNRGRFILCIGIAVAVVLAVLFGMSIFFKVDAEKILVSGTKKYSIEQVVEAAGIKDGENLFAISEARISTRVIDQLPYVKQVRVGIKLPDTVKIEIEELEVVYSVEADDGSWWLIRSDGGVIDRTNSADAQLYTQILGVKITEPVVGQSAKALQPITETPEGETEPVTVRASEQLAVACTVMEYLEDSGIIGEMTSIDVTNLGDIQLWYGDEYQILLGDTMEMSFKIRTLKSTLDQVGQYQSGVLDISFTVWPDKVGYTPFS